MRYKIVASDLDGTLFDSNGVISKENLSAIEEMEQNGVDFVPASGRGLSEFPDELKNNPFIRYVIYSNGAVVENVKNGDKILNCIPNDTKDELLDIFFKTDCHITVRCDGKCYIDKEFSSKKWFEYYSINPEHKNVISMFGKPTENFKEFCYEAKDIEVFSVFFKNDEEKEMCKNFIGKSDLIDAALIYENNLEIFSATAGKGNALMALADKLGVRRNETISVGDSDNDRTMTIASGLGLVTSNARTSLKEIADEIICSNDEHIVRYIMDKFIER